MILARPRVSDGRHHALTAQPPIQRAVLKQDGYFAASARDGSMRPDSIDGHGLWFSDTRFLSEYRLLIDGREPEMVDLRTENGWASFDLASGSLLVRRDRYIDRGLHERITIVNSGSSPVDADLELVFAADFAAMLVVRGILNLPPPLPGPTTQTSNGVLIRGHDSHERSTEVVLSPGGTKHHLKLGPGEKFTVAVDVVIRAGNADADERSALSFDLGLVGAVAAYRTWAADCTLFRTDNPALNELLDQSRDDLRMLVERYPTGLYPTAGMPWFAVPFGRDGLVTSLQTLSLNPDVARGVLRYLAINQGRRHDSYSDEAPGKILHEVRTGDVVDLGLWAHIDFGTVDATPLFLCMLAEAVNWTGDLDLFDEMWPAAEAALGWCQTDGDADADGFIEDTSGRSRNQGWKDSSDSLTHADGTAASHPAALCEVQGYLYRGLLGMAGKRPELKARANEVRYRFNRDFWIPRERYVAQGLDGEKRRIEAITSEPGHCLWSGILTPGHARHVAARLASPDLFSGWGVRTLSNRAINYDPLSYHNGSIWPHDTAIAAAGLRRSGFSGEAELIARAVLEAGMALPHRQLAELWSGTDRVPDEPPGRYRNSCSPQAWGAGAAILLITTLLGLDADARRGRLRIAPVETPLWRRLNVTGLNFAGHRIDFSVEGTQVKVGALPRGIKVETPAR